MTKKNNKRIKASKLTLQAFTFEAQPVEALPQQPRPVVRARQPVVDTDTHCEACKPANYKGQGKLKLCKGAYDDIYNINTYDAVKQLAVEVMRMNYKLGFYRCNMGRTCMGNSLHITKNCWGDCFWWITPREAHDILTNEEALKRAVYDAGKYAVQDSFKFYTFPKK